MSDLDVLDIGPSATVQDGGRPGWAARGLSPGGVADRRAWLEAAALLGGSPRAVIEMLGRGGRFAAARPARIALTGAEMQARIGARRVQAGESDMLSPGEVLDVGAIAGFGYLAIGGGVETPPLLGSRSAHLTAGLGRVLRKGDRLPIGPDDRPGTSPSRIALAAGTGPLRVMPGPQTDLFPPEVRARFERTDFTRGTALNRQGLRLGFDGEGFAAPGQLSLASAPIIAGDIQIVGDGAPAVLLAECQTIGGYPRIGTLLPADLHRLLRAAPHAPLRFRFVTPEEADASWQSDEDLLKDLRRQMEPRIRDPHDISELGGYQLISGVWGERAP